MPEGTPTNLVPQPSGPKPLYPDIPWWAALVAALLSAFAGVIGTALLMSGGVSPTGVKLELGPAASLAVDTVTYTPHIMLLFGVLADMFTYQGVWSIPSIVGLFSIFLNFAMKYFWVGLFSFFERAQDTFNIGSKKAPVPTTGGAAPGSFFKKYNGCSVQGFEGFASEYAPQTLVVTATVFSYYLFDSIGNRGWINSIAGILIFLVTFISQIAVLATTAGDQGCGAPSPDDTSRMIASDYTSMQQGIMAFAEGLLFGGSAYGIVQTYYPNRLPSSVISPFGQRSKSELTVGPDGKMYDADGYPWVVLPNGQTFPDMSSAQSRQAFAAIASRNLGTGSPAVPASCNGNTVGQTLATCQGNA